MRAQDISLYFSRKIAKAIPRDMQFTLDDGIVNRRYSIEPVAVSGGTLHVDVTMKKEEGAIPRERNRTRAVQPEISLRDGDSIDLLLDMAIVASDFCERRHRALSSDSRRDHRLALAYREVHSRIDPVKAAPLRRVFEEQTRLAAASSWLEPQDVLADLGTPAVADRCFQPFSTRLSCVEPLAFCLNFALYNL